MEVSQRECTGLTAGDLLQCRSKMLGPGAHLVRGFERADEGYPLVASARDGSARAHEHAEGRCIVLSEGILIERDVSE